MSYYPDPYNKIKIILDSKATKKSKINQISQMVFEYYCLGENNTKQNICDLLGVDRIDRYRE